MVGTSELSDKTADYRKMLRTAAILLRHQLAGFLPRPKEAMMEFEAVLRRVRSEFVEMPGLRPTPAQATILWD
jgi:hypothetical protein